MFSAGTLRGPVSGRNFLADLPTCCLENFKKLRSSCSYPEGTTLFAEGQAVRGIYVITEGRLKLSTTSRDGKTLILRIGKPGEIVGLHAAISGQPYEFTAEAVQPSRLDFIPRSDFLRFLSNHPDACLNAARHLSCDCRNTYDMIRALGLSHSVSEKLARLILDWAANGEVTEDGISVRIALKHEEIAQLIGTSRETVTRVLTEFREKKLAEFRGATLLIRDQAALRRLTAA
jgi:CRP/FNR family transcriptional regulator, cyclic AMP receptor protein